ncbi:hypothetical protein [Hansschlegelia zhihuaiae]|uniref:Uncharacterized protein n=1 Tax=Hansschlegelia zhihuaiae TaxID=405005 RepID=A0A4Q0MHU0_9HYPH|nr:hypothetical protein [Hansschlegelia zhihuaiae]RXF73004.1 hypothetical protein EK403_12770 [Hansschlegelia zhihuaiae]
MRALLTSLALSIAAASAAAAQPAEQPASPASAEELSPLFCTVTSAQLCSGESCSRAETFGQVKLPAQVLIHFGQKIIASTNADGFPHVTSIASLAEAGGDFILQGVDGPSGWMIHLGSADPKMTFTVASNDAVLTGIGACKKPPE